MSLYCNVPDKVYKIGIYCLLNRWCTIQKSCPIFFFQYFYLSASNEVTLTVPYGLGFCYTAKREWRNRCNDWGQQGALKLAAGSKEISLYFVHCKKQEGHQILVSILLIKMLRNPKLASILSADVWAPFEYLGNSYYVKRRYYRERRFYIDSCVRER